MTRARCTQGRRRIGVWLIGSKGRVAITTIVGLVALHGFVPQFQMLQQWLGEAHPANGQK